MQVDFGVDRDVACEPDLPLVSNDADRAFETCRPSSRKQLFRIGANARRPRKRKLDIEPAVGTARHAVFAAAGRMSLRRINHLVGGFDGALICNLRHGSLLEAEAEAF